MRIHQNNGTMLQIPISTIDSINYYNNNPGSPASLTTLAIGNINSNSAASGGIITNDGGSPITQRGLCWSTSQFPTTANYTAAEGKGIGSFAINITGLDANTTYFVRAFAINTSGTMYGNQVSFTTLQIPVNPGTIIDTSGNSYPTVTIGTQVWMAENLRTTKYRDGSNIPIVTAKTQWENNYLNDDSLPMMCWYNNDQTGYYSANKFGALYNWYAINPATNGNKNVCPTGWHIPSDAEWTTLTTFLGGESVAGGKMKTTGTQFWITPNVGATNSSGFSGLPGGYRYYDGFFYVIDGLGYWWSSTEKSTYNAWFRILNYAYGSTYRTDDNKANGYSVRCVMDYPATLTTLAVSNIRANTATSGGKVISSGGSPVTKSGICWSTTQNPTTANYTALASSTTDSFSVNLTGLAPNTTYYVRAYAINIIGTAYGEQVSFTTLKTVSDASGNTYPIVTIGTQVWMAENLRTTKYTDGSNIPVVNDSVQWANNYNKGNPLQNPMMCWYSNDQATYTSNKFGALYNWYAINPAFNGNKNVCPTGMHMPTNAEWNRLLKYLDPSADTTCNSCNQSTIAGGIMKSVGTQYWLSPNTYATDNFGFSGLPGGSRGYDGKFYAIGQYGFWWSSNAWFRRLVYNFGYVYSSSSTNPIYTSGFSVRCLKDYLASLSTLDIIGNITTNSATSGGLITNDDGSPVTQRGICWANTQNPTTENNIALAGSGTGSFTANLTGLAANTTYYVRAYAINAAGTAYGNQVSFTTLLKPVNPGSVTDASGNIYTTITIGNKEWMAENLRTTKYSDGSNIPLVTNNTQWANNWNNGNPLKQPMMCWYNNDQATNAANKFGGLYNWYVINPANNGNKNVCPTSWHVPSDSELNILIGSLDPSYNVTAFGLQSKNAGGMMKSTGTQYWLSPNAGATNNSGFSALPGGSRYDDGSFFSIGYNGYWWSSTSSGANVSWARNLSTNNEAIYRNFYNKTSGFSIRCVKD
jgi:uncharacterized protein (TIGR02145 family)